MKSQGGKPKRTGLHRGFEQLRQIDDPAKTAEVIERITGRRKEPSIQGEDFEKRYSKYFPEGEDQSPQGVRLESVPLKDVSIDLKHQFPGIKEYFLQVPHVYWEKIAPTLHPFADILYTKAWRESYGRNRRVYFRAGLRYVIQGTSLKSRKAVETARNDLIQKKLLIRVLNDEAPHKGTLYRVVSPDEYITGMLLEGVFLQDVPLEGLPSKTRSYDL